MHKMRNRKIVALKTVLAIVRNEVITYICSFS